MKTEIINEAKVILTFFFEEESHFEILKIVDYFEMKNAKAKDSKFNMLNKSIAGEKSYHTCMEYDQNVLIVGITEEQSDSFDFDLLKIFKFKPWLSQI